jgi:4-amino-4-deoxychorismate lyase
MSPSGSIPSHPSLVESIRLDPEGPANLSYHQARFDRSRSRFYPDAVPVELREHLEPLDRPPGGKRYKVRIVYDREIREVTSRIYTVRNLEKVWLVEDDSVDYRYKYLDRSGLDRLKGSAVSPERAADEEILILKSGLVTDTTFSNVAFFDGREWVTPESCLLPGTRRARLLDEGRVRPVRIRGGDIDRYEEISFINAMLDLGELTLSVDRIHSGQIPGNGPRCIGEESR